jgi:hypothetical protein
MPCFPFQGSAVKEPTRHQPSPPQLHAAGSSFPSQSTKTHRTSRTRGSGRPAGRNRLSQLRRVASYAHCLRSGTSRNEALITELLPFGLGITNLFNRSSAITRRQDAYYALLVRNFDCEYVILCKSSYMEDCLSGGNGILTFAVGTLPLKVFGVRGYGQRQGLADDTRPHCASRLPVHFRHSDHPLGCWRSVAVFVARVERVHGLVDDAGSWANEVARRTAEADKSHA